MAILKLEVGKPIVFHVSDVEQVEGQFGPQTKFEGDGGDCLFLSRPTAQRQMDRIGDIQPGDVLRFEKVQKGTKTFVNIDRVEGNGSGPASAGKAGASTSGGAVASSLPPQPPTQPAAKEKLTAVYEQSLDFVLSRVVPKLVKAGVPVSHEGVSAMTSTVFIAANNGHR